MNNTIHGGFSILKERAKIEPYIPSKNEIRVLAHSMEEPLMIFGSYLMLFQGFWEQEKQR